MKRILAGLIVAVAMAGAAVAGPLEDGLAAQKRGDYATALKLLLPLADEGNAQAQNNLGLMYDNGRGVPQDSAEAVKWYRKAADQGDAQAQTNLGLDYEFGIGVPQDYVLAHMWLNLAAAQGNKVSSEERDVVAAKMTRDQIAEAQRLAREWKPKTQP